MDKLIIIQERTLAKALRSQNFEADAVFNILRVVKESAEVIVRLDKIKEAYKDFSPIPDLSHFMEKKQSKNKS